MESRFQTDHDIQRFHPTRMEVSLSGLRRNYATVRRLLSPPCDIMAVVKGDGYGLGMHPAAEVFFGEGCRRFAVATIDEGLSLRAALRDVEILLLGIPPVSATEAVVRQNLCATCGDMAFASALRDAAKAVGRRGRIHLKVDTGLGRIGFFPDELVEAVRTILAWGDLEIAGIYTHFATADEENLDYTRAQYRRFAESIEDLERNGISLPLRHACNSAGLINVPEAHLDAVRAGLLLYGYRSGFENRVVPKTPTVTVKSTLASVRTLPPGHPVGYGLRYVTRGTQRLGIIPMGFHDGLVRSMKNAQFLLRGHRVTAVGAICMDSVTVDLTALPDAAVGDEAVFIGRQGDEEITAQEVADRLDTIVAQVFSFFSPRVKRIYLD